MNGQEHAVFLRRCYSGDAMQFLMHNQCPDQGQLYQQWCQLATSPFERPEWLLTWWEVFADRHRGSELVLVGAYEAGQLIALAPLYRHHSSLRQLGDGEVCTDHLGLLIGRGSRDVHHQLLRWLHQDAECHWQMMCLECVDDSSMVWDSVQGSLGIQRRQPATGNCFLPLPRDFEAYLSSLSKNHRKRCRRWLRHYFESGRARSLSTSPVASSGCDQQWASDRAFNTLKNLHEQRRGEIDGGAFRNPRFTEFLWLAFQRLAALGMAEISAIEVDGVVMAAEFELHSPTTTFAYQSGLATDGLIHDAGSLSLMHRIGNAIARAKSTYDFMRGVESYKFHWGAHVQTTSQIQLWPSNLSGHLACSTAAVVDYSLGLARSIAGRL